MGYLDAHHAKLRLAEDLLSPEYQQYVAFFDEADKVQKQPGLTNKARFARAKSLAGMSGNTHVDGLQQILRSAETFTMTLPMLHLVRASAEEMPNEWPLLPEEVPALSGVLWLPEPFEELDLHGRRLRQHLVVWSPVEHGRQGYGLWVNWFTDKDDPHDELNAEL